jgi:uncharacterized protein (TIGR03435 family)
MTRHMCIFLLALTLAPAVALIAPPPLAAQTRLTFDVASIHPSKPGQVDGGIKPIPGGHGYTARNIPLKLMISLMFKVPEREIRGGPEWLTNDRWDIEARADASYSIDDLHTMFQNLLADRFQLKFHKEAQTGNIYALTVDPAGLKLTPNTTPQHYSIPMNGGPAHIVGAGVPMNYFTWWLGQQLRDESRPVVDQTGLTGYYDFTLSFQPILPPDQTADTLPPELRDLPTIFTALRDQLGLKLTPTKGSFDIFVVDRVERASEN